MLPASTEAATAVTRALSRSREALYDEVVVVDEHGRYRGFLSVRQLESAGGALRTWVENTGIGIRPEDLEWLFVPFGQLEAAETKQHAGTGLGLVVARSVATLLGGRIEVASRPGAGSTFTLTLPAHPPDCEAT